MKDVWDYLALEIAVKIHEVLSNDDEDSRIYEYIGEATRLVGWLKKSDLEPSVFQIEDQVKRILEETLEHSYDPEAFESTAKFALNRLELFRRQGLI